MHAPSFWDAGGPRWPGRLLAPLGTLVAQATARRVARPGWRAPVPVICCGSPMVGGAGKTPVAIAIGERLRSWGVEVHYLTRGYGGRAQDTVRVDPAVQDASEVGDEALLLARVAPAWAGPDRVQSARAAIAAGAQALVMDDGLQNPGLAKTLSLMVVDGGAGFGNRRVMPAGPLREPVREAASRCGAVVLIGEDTTGALSDIGLPVLRARALPGPEVAALAGQRVLAFAGIGRPAKFFAMLRAAGIRLVGERGFADHHVFRPAELDALAREAARLGAMLVCTEKDVVRLAPEWRGRVTSVGLRLAFDDPASLDARLAEALR